MPSRDKMQKLIFTKENLYFSWVTDKEDYCHIKIVDVKILLEEFNDTDIKINQPSNKSHYFQ
jgi:hypothetical protein